jgi:rod shape-determining protein MreC
MLQAIVIPIQAISFRSFSFFGGIGESEKVKELENKNTQLIKQLINQEKIIKDNKALLDQFQTQDPKSVNLIPAEIIGVSGFLPGITLPEGYILDRGETDGIKVGDAVVYKNNLIGKVIKTTKFLSNIEVVSNSKSLFTAKDLQTGALGVAKGQGGGGLILDNVILSDTIRVGDLIVTKGDVNQSGMGIIPDLVLGQVEAVSKNPSDLFQKAKLKMLIDFSKLEKVFVVNLR